MLSDIIGCSREGGTNAAKAEGLLAAVEEEGNGTEKVGVLDTSW